MDVLVQSGIPTNRTDQELPGIPLAWLKADGKTAVELASMGAILKVQILRANTVIVEQTDNLTPDDLVPNWVLDKFSDATLAEIEADLDEMGCSEFDYDFVPMFRRPSDTADDIFNPPNGFKWRFTRAPS